MKIPVTINKITRVINCICTPYSYDNVSIGIRDNMGYIDAGFYFMGLGYDGLKVYEGVSNNIGVELIKSRQLVIIGVDDI